MAKNIPAKRGDSGIIILWKFWRLQLARRYTILERTDDKGEVTTVRSGGHAVKQKEGMACDC